MLASTYFTLLAGVVQNRFLSDERQYNAFLKILNQYREGHMSITQVYEEVSPIFTLCKPTGYVL
jgi:histone deacetylase complex regulatory component SIN3